MNYFTENGTGLLSYKVVPGSADTESPLDLASLDCRKEFFSKKKATTITINLRIIVMILMVYNLIQNLVFSLYFL